MHRASTEIIKLNRYFLENKESFNKEFGETLKKARFQNGFVIEQTSERALITPRYLSNLEQGKYSISLLKFICLCNSLEITPNELLEEFLFSCKTNDDILYNQLQKNKNLSENVLHFMKEKK